MVRMDRTLIEPLNASQGCTTGRLEFKLGSSPQRVQGDNPCIDRHHTPSNWSALRVSSPMEQRRILSIESHLTNKIPRLKRTNLYPTSYRPS